MFPTLPSNKELHCGDVIEVHCLPSVGNAHAAAIAWSVLLRWDDWKGFAPQPKAQKKGIKNVFATDRAGVNVRQPKDATVFLNTYKARSPFKRNLKPPGRRLLSPVSQHHTHIEKHHTKQMSVTPQFPVVQAGGHAMRGSEEHVLLFLFAFRTSPFLHGGSVIVTEAGWDIMEDGSSAATNGYLFPHCAAQHLGAAVAFCTTQFGWDEGLVWSPYCVRHTGMNRKVAGVKAAVEELLSGVTARTFKTYARSNKERKRAL